MVHLCTVGQDADESDKSVPTRLTGLFFNVHNRFLPRYKGSREVHCCYSLLLLRTTDVISVAQAIVVADVCSASGLSGRCGSGYCMIVSTSSAFEGIASKGRMLGRL